MIFGQDRDELRQTYRDAWAKAQRDALLTPLEAQIVAVIELHPEYHDEVENADLAQEYTPEGGRSNPYLHMGLHLGLREQVATDRPNGIRHIFDVLAGRLGDPHDAEHRMIDCLAETLWEAQSKNIAPDENNYLQSLNRLIR